MQKINYKIAKGTVIESLENISIDAPSSKSPYSPQAIICPINSVYDIINKAPSKEKICHCINLNSSGDINSPDYYRKKWIQVDGSC